MDNLLLRQNEIKYLQENLSSIRKIAGWTSEELGDKIGVTKQTISNLENNRTPMTLTQYIAIRTVLDYEIQTNTEDQVLHKVTTILLDKSQDLTKEQYEKVKEAAKILSITSAGGVTGDDLFTLFKALFSGFAFGAIIGVGVSVAGSWLKKLLK